MSHEHNYLKLCIDAVTSENTLSSIARWVPALLGRSPKNKQEVL